MKPLFGLAAAGVISILLWKLLGIILLPLVGVALGMLVTLLKFAVIFTLIMFVVWLLRKKAGENSL